jgi:hypothetical protein
MIFIKNFQTFYPFTSLQISILPLLLTSKLALGNTSAFTYPSIANQFQRSYSTFKPDISETAQICLTEESSNLNNRDFALGSPEQNLAPQWVTGIADSEGNFSITTQKVEKGYKFSLAFKVTQKDHSAGILYDLLRYFECGSVHIDNRKENALKFNVTKLDDIVTKIIPHFDMYPLLTSKNLDYQDFRKVAFMMVDKLHLTEEGGDNIRSIKENMNSKRSFEER